MKSFFISMLYCFFTALMVFALVKFVPDGWTEAATFSDSEIISIALAAVTIVLTVLAIILGIGGLFGYREIRNFISGEIDKKLEERLSMKLPEVVQDELDDYLQASALRRQVGDDDG